MCGRVLYSAFHVAGISGAGSKIFPSYCSTGPLTAQEKVLEFMIFDLSACVSVGAPPPPATCTPKTCTGIGANCGPVADGCGGILDCGSCTAPASCGGGGTAQQVRQQLQANDLRRQGRQLRHDRGRLRRHARLWILRQPGGVRRRRNQQCLRRPAVSAAVLFCGSRRVWTDRGWLRQHDQLWHVRDGYLRRWRHAERVRRRQLCAAQLSERRRELRSDR